MNKGNLISNFLLNLTHTTEEYNSNPPAQSSGIIKHRYGKMANLYMPPQSFESEEETDLAKQIQSKYSRLLRQIDNKVTITVIGRNNKDFWEAQVTVPQSRNMILNAKNENPLHPSDEITHLAVVTTKDERERGYLYGNTGAPLLDFVRAVIFKTMVKFPSMLN
jgi:hypothetical protein